MSPRRDGEDQFSPAPLAEGVGGWPRLQSNSERTTRPPPSYSQIQQLVRGVLRPILSQDSLQTQNTKKRQTHACSEEKYRVKRQGQEGRNPQVFARRFLDKINRIARGEDDRLEAHDVRPVNQETHREPKGKDVPLSSGRNPIALFCPDHVLKPVDVRTLLWFGASTDDVDDVTTRLNRAFYSEGNHEGIAIRPALEKDRVVVRRDVIFQRIMNLNGGTMNGIPGQGGQR